MSGNKDSDGGWRKFVWNSERSEFLGRTGSSWLKIFLFYVIFYGCLAGIFVGTIQALLLTLDNYKPTYQDRVAPPGLSHTPRSEKSEISFKMSEAGTYQKYIETMEKFLKLYDLENQNNLDHYEDCGDTPGPYKDRSDGQDPPGQKKSCRFQRTLLESCSGKDDDTYGFKQGNPCLIVKLNRIVNYRPRAPSNDTLPEGLKGKSFTNLIPIHCKNKREEDAAKIGEIKYYGFSEGGVVGFPLQYYPYYGKQLHGKYLQPLVAIQFTNLTLGEELRIECKVYGDNIYYNEKDRYQGRFDVKFTVNS
ncbi:sodium/potassium-transporting ATPase subunit beta-1a [Fundulus heteroclitus]|uniref:sodium/potassium-transporting ATPase subunit beta-1a n=1 Tax=Fundulus heteroclitus TaxID=8078 RepID=UPI00165C2DB3|nr:sodium/potassium-transporting ATPase subunit beta-1a [Fundulus heteroclitus]